MLLLLLLLLLWVFSEHRRPKRSGMYSANAAVDKREGTTESEQVDWSDSNKARRMVSIVLLLLPHHHPPNPSEYYSYRPKTTTTTTAASTKTNKKAPSMIPFLLSFPKPNPTYEADTDWVFVIVGITVQDDGCHCSCHSLEFANEESYQDA